MNDSPVSEPTKATEKVAPETLELRARPQPVTRINPRLLVGAAAAGLIGIASIVLLALRPPSFRGDVAQELYAVDRKPITAGLAKLPTSYEDVRPAVSDRRDAPSLPAGVPPLQTVSADPRVEAERVEKERLARMEGQAREAPVFFRLQLKSPSQGSQQAHLPADDRLPTGMPEGAGGLSARGPQQAPDRAAVVDATGADAQLTDAAADPQRKLAFLRSAPSADAANPHRLHRLRWTFRLQTKEHRRLAHLPFHTREPLLLDALGFDRWIRTHALQRRDTGLQRLSVATIVGRRTNVLVA